MTIFDGNLNAKIKAVYIEQNRKDPLGTVAGNQHNVTIIVSEAYTNTWQSKMITQTSDILVYGQADSKLASHKCVGGTLEFEGRRLRIENFAVGRNQRTGEIDHTELGCSEL